MIIARKPDSREAAVRQLIAIAETLPLPAVETLCTTAQSFAEDLDPEVEEVEEDTTEDGLPWFLRRGAWRLQASVERLVVGMGHRAELKVRYRLFGLSFCMQYVRKGRDGWFAAGGERRLRGGLADELESLFLDELDKIDREASRRMEAGHGKWSR